MVVGLRLTIKPGKSRDLAEQVGRMWKRDQNIRFLAAEVATTAPRDLLMPLGCEGKYLH